MGVCLASLSVGWSVVLEETAATGIASEIATALAVLAFCELTAILGGASTNSAGAVVFAACKTFFLLTLKCVSWPWRCRRFVSLQQYWAVHQPL